MKAFRINQEEALSKYVNLLPSERAHNVISEAEYLRKQAVKIRRKIRGIFELQKEELPSRRGEKSMLSRKTSHPCISKISSTFQFFF